METSFLPRTVPSHQPYLRIHGSHEGSGDNREDCSIIWAVYGTMSHKKGIGTSSNTKYRDSMEGQSHSSRKKKTYRKSTISSTTSPRVLMTLRKGLRQLYASTLTSQDTLWDSALVLLRGNQINSGQLIQSNPKSLARKGTEKTYLTWAPWGRWRCIPVRGRPTIFCNRHINNPSKIVWAH